LIITNLKSAEDENSAYGLVLEPTAETKIIPASDFSHKNDSKNFRTINPDYSIEFDDNSNRTLYTRDNGLSRLFLDGYLILYSNSGNLAYSGEDGRGGLVRCGATREDFQNYIMQEVDREYKAKVSKLETRLANKRNAQLAKAIAFLEAE